MNASTDILIIGGGVIGASIAYYLARTRYGRIILLERQALSSGTTGRSGAIIRQHYANDFTIRMAKESLHVFQHFDEFIGGDCGFASTGLLVISNEQGAEALRENVQLQQQLGVNTRLLQSKDISDIAPGYFRNDVALACYEEDAGVADPIATTYCFAQRARDYGASIQEGVAVTHIQAEGGHIKGVKTTAGDILAPIVILAANVWSPALVRPLGIHLPVTATRHPMLILRRPNDFGGRHDLHPVCFDTIQNIYLRPDIGGLTLVGATNNVMIPENPDHYQQGLTEEEIHYFATTAAQRIPALGRAVPRGSWAGIYDDTPDYHPILGPQPEIEGLYYAVGFSGHGFKLSPVIGQWMAKCVCNGQMPEDMQHFTYERFHEGREIHPRYASGVLG
jgi:sarcosine oxidase, subunit beta